MSKLENVIVISVKKGEGTSTKSGAPKPYSFANVTYLAPAQDFMNENHAIQTSGFDTRDINMLFDTALYNKFMNTFKFAEPATLVLGPDPQNPARNIVVDFEQ